MSIGFVIVTYNSQGVLRDCLASIPAGYPVVVVDNASADGSTELAASFGADVVRNAKNVGFGAACNQGAKRLSTAYVFFLNPDAVLTANAVAELEKAIARFPEAGGFAPAVKTEGVTRAFRTKSYIQDQGRRYMDDALAPTDYAKIDFIDGAALLCRVDVFHGIGGFDENLFLYFEDDDLSYRLRAESRDLIYVPQSVVTHKKKASSGNHIRLDYFRSWHETRSRILLSQKYGLPFDVHREKKRAIIRLARSIATLQLRKAARYLGVTRALRAFAAS